MPDGADGMRIDLFLAGARTDLTRSLVQAMLRAGAVALDGRGPAPSTRVRPGQVIRLPTAAPAAAAGSHPEPEPVSFAVVYEDADVVVIDKPPGLVVHPAPGHESGTLVNGLLARYPELSSREGERPGIVHRLDKDTSGLIIVARNQAALHFLQGQMQRRQALKEYTLLCCGRLRRERGTLEGSIGRHPRDRKRMAVVSTGRAAVTEYEVQEVLGTYTLALARLATGRTHQIRVHFASAGHALAGDALYGGCECAGLSRQFLHSSRLALTLPSGANAEWTSPLPNDLAEVLSRLRAGRA